MSVRPETSLYGSVYVGLMNNGMVKIGISLDPARRRRQLETATGAKVLEWMVFQVYAPGACERYLLQRWDWCRVNGEWFEGGKQMYRGVVDYLTPRAQAA